MIGSPFELAHDDNNPLDLVEEYLRSKGWKLLRHDGEFLSVKIPGLRTTYEAALEWQEEFSALLFSCSLPIDLSDEQYETAIRALDQVNQNIWMGHFDLSGKNMQPTYRYTMMLRMIPAGIAVDLAADLCDIAVAECDRFYTTFQLVQSGDVSLEENIHAAVFETVGEA